MDAQLTLTRATNLPTLEFSLLGRKITCITIPAVIDRVQQACDRHENIVIGNYNIHAFNMSIQHSWFYDFLQNADICHCDGAGILLALRFMGHQVPIDYRVSYTLLMPRLLEYCNQKGLSVYLLGAKNNLLKIALYNLRCEYPNIRFLGHHGYFHGDDPVANQHVVDDINRFNPNILIVGMGMPRQEAWVQNNRFQLNVNATFVGGAVIDRFAGQVIDCPDPIANLGLEWLFRLAQEPRRLLSRYILGNPAFLLQVALAKSLAR